MPTFLPGATRMIESLLSSTLTWTGERMVPHESDLITELFHWQRYLFFRPWYAGKKVIDAASGEGYGTGYMATFAASALGIDLASDVVQYARTRYDHAKFEQADVCDFDYSEADLVVSFETLAHVENYERFLEALSTCKGQIVISVPNRAAYSPGNTGADKPHNRHHIVEWTADEFAKVIEDRFPDRQVRFLSQENRWPCLIRPGLDASAKHLIAVVGDGDLPVWPKLGIAMPTCDGADRAYDTFYNFCKYYPGEIEFAIVANGSAPDALKKLREIRNDAAHVVHLIESPENVGYGGGANLGLEMLRDKAGFDLYGVVNDDVLPSVDCVCQMVSALAQLREANYNPGLIGPVSNMVSGEQLADIGQFQDYKQMMRMADLYRVANHTAATKAHRVRGIFFLITPECLDKIGGFDPRYGLGNFEDDDLGMRAKMAGFTLWYADGAFLYHAGSSTFKELGLNYQASIDRNLAIFLEKWSSPSYELAVTLKDLPPGVDLYVPFRSEKQNSGFEMNLGTETIDLVYQASEGEFAAWLMLSLRESPREARLEIIKAISKLKAAA